VAPGRSKLNFGKPRAPPVEERGLQGCKAGANLRGAASSAAAPAKTLYRIPASDSTKWVCGSRGSASNRAN